MSNTIIELRHSYVTGNTPSSLANGEIAINTYDGKLFYRGGPSNTIQTIERFTGPAGLDTEIQFNDSGVLGSSANLKFNKSTGIFSTKLISVTNSDGDEGGEILLAKAVTNTTLTGTGITIDSYQNKIRFFEQGGSARGAYIDLTECSGGAGTNLLNPTSTPDSIARNTANAAFIAANSAGVAANTPSHVANSASIYANGAFIAANSAGSYANSAFIHANAAFNKANTGGALTVSLTDDSNNFTNVVTSVTGIRFDANSGFDITDLGSGNVKVGMNSTFKTWKITGQQDLIANGLDTIEFVGSNGVVLTSNTLASPKTITFNTSSVFNKANAAFTVANNANTVYVSDSPPSSPVANTLWWQSNTATLKIYYNDGITSQWVDASQTYALDTIARNTGNAAFIAANSAGSYANSAFIHANAAFNAANSAADTWVRNQANAAFEAANSAGSYANSAFGVANSASVYANTPSHVANSAAIYANGAFAAANAANATDITQNNSITAAFTAANSAGIYANGAFARANNALNANTGGTVTGDVSITGNLSVLGNTFSVSATTIVANDTILVLGANNYTSDLLDIGFAAHYNDSVNAHTGFIRDHGTKEWQLFEGYTPEIGANNQIDINDPSFKIATLNANVHSTKILIKGIDLLPYVNNAYLTANTAFNTANNEAGVNLTQNTNISFAWNHANSAFTQANSVYLPSVTRLDVTNSGSSAYLFDQYGSNNPNIFIRAGETLAFNLNVTGHPFLIRVSNGGAQYNTGLTHVSNTGIVVTGSSAQAQVSGTLYWKVPAEIAGNTYVYQCQVHGGMVGNIIIETPNQANSAASYANAAFIHANNASIAANTPSDVANSASIYANGAFIAANAADAKAITAGSYANSAFAVANNEAAVNATQNTTIQLAWNHANSAYNQANNGGASVSVGDSPPTSPTANSLWWQSNTGDLKIYYNDGTSSQWVDAFGSSYSLDQWARDQANAAFNQANTGGGGGASVSVGDSPPAAPTANSLWWQSNTAILKIYYDDGTSSQWVDASPAFPTVTPSVTVNSFSGVGDGSNSTFGLGFNPPAASKALMVTIDGVVQPENTYSTNTSNQTISFTTAPAASENVYVVSFYTAANLVEIAAQSVTPDKLAPSTNTYIQTVASAEGIALAIALG